MCLRVCMCICVCVVCVCAFGLCVLIQSYNTFHRVFPYSRHPNSPNSPKACPGVPRSPRITSKEGFDLTHTAGAERGCVTSGKRRVDVPLQVQIGYRL